MARPITLAALDALTPRRSLAKTQKLLETR
jgi:hypothetical protein